MTNRRVRRWRRWVWVLLVTVAPTQLPAGDATEPVPVPVGCDVLGPDCVVDTTTGDSTPPVVEVQYFPDVFDLP